MSKVSSFRILLYLLCIPAIFLFTGCADDLRNRSLFDCGAGDAVISYTVADVILTRDSEEEDFESVVDHAYLLFYSSDASVRTDVPVAAVRAESDPGNSGVLKFKMPLTLNPNTDYKLLAIANADTYTPSGFENYGAYLESWCKNYSATSYAPLQLFCQSQIKPERLRTFPMSGEVKDGSVFRFSTNDGNYKISSSLSFRRKVARIDVANIVKEGFKVEAVLLCNYRDAVDIYPTNEIVGKTLGGLHGVLSEESAAETDFVSMPVASEDGIQRLNKQIYCFPSFSYESYMGDKESTALIIKAKYGQDTSSSYYRVNVGINGNVSEVKSNTKYLITIRSVKGSGATTPEEAYAAKESPIVLSVVEDWDLDGSNFAMDEKGNFIVVSSSKFEFEGDDLDNREVKVLTSKGLNWSVAYVPDNQESSEAFVVSKFSESSFTISPVEKNTGSNPFSGKCMVTAPTSDGEQLSVYIPVTQQFKPYEPEIPDMDFTILPVNGDRVKIDHINKTIEIDAFDPDCFNSFIDIPFKAYIKPGTSVTKLTIQSADLLWPLEGGITKSSMRNYCYCANSFAEQHKLYSRSDEKEVSASKVVTVNVIVDVKDKDEFYISVGAMAPDDPAIKRTVSILDQNENQVNYNLIIKPCPTIIDDVIISDSQGHNWLIFDRNIQDVSASYSNYIGLNEEGLKYQAYNYTSIPVSSSSNTIGIPCKFSNAQNTQNTQNTQMYEDAHKLYMGVWKSLKEKNVLQSSNEDQTSSLKYQWLQKYKCSNPQNCTSPFYDDYICEKWQFPTEELLHLCASKIKVSKMRMFLVSEVSVKDRKNKIPVCCYWPFHGSNAYIDLAQITTYGYFAADESGELVKIVCLYCDNTKIGTIDSNESKAIGMSRLVRPLTDDELTNYKQNYLGYGSQTHKLILCHPDTYDSPGWLKY